MATSCLQSSSAISIPVSLSATLKAQKTSDIKTNNQTKSITSIKTTNKQQIVTGKFKFRPTCRRLFCNPTCSSLQSNLGCIPAALCRSVNNKNAFKCKRSISCGQFHLKVKEDRSIGEAKWSSSTQTSRLCEHLPFIVSPD